MIVVQGGRPKESILKKALVRALIVVGGCLLVAFCANVVERLPAPATTERQPTIVPPSAHAPLRLSEFRPVVMSRVSLRLSGVIENSDDTARRDVRLRCTQNGASGSVIRTQEITVFEVIPAKGRRSFRDLTLGFVDDQMKTVGCEIIEARF